MVLYAADTLLSMYALATLFCTGLVLASLIDVSTVTAALVMAVLTNAVVANCVVFVPAAAVGAFGVPVNVGEARLAFKPKAELMALFCTGLVLDDHTAASTVAAALSTAVLTKAVVASCVVLVPAAAVGAVGVPVRPGEARGANIPLIFPHSRVSPAVSRYLLINVEVLVLSI